MLFILDTNIFHHNWRLQSEASKAFLDYVHTTRSKIVMPMVIWDEIRKNYREELDKKVKEYTKQCKFLSSVLIEAVDFKRFPESDGELDVMAENYMDYLKSLLRLKASSFITYEQIFLERVTKRAVYWKAPFVKESQKSFKDALIWEMLLERAKRQSNERKTVHEGKELTYISSNPKDFASKDSNAVLHPELAQEIEGIGRVIGKDFFYYNNLEEFVKGHYTIISAINYDDVDAVIANSMFPHAEIHEELLNKAQWKKFGTALAARSGYMYRPNMRQFSENAEILGMKLIGHYAYEYHQSKTVVVFMEYLTEIQTRFEFVDWQDKMPDEEIVNLSLNTLFSVSFDNGIPNEPDLEKIEISNEKFVVTPIMPINEVEDDFHL